MTKLDFIRKQRKQGIPSCRAESKWKEINRLRIPEIIGVIVFVLVVVFLPSAF